MNEQPGTAIGSGDGRLFVAPAPGELNKALPNFEVECLIGQGGMGAVYKARQPKLDRFVAIKVLPASLGLSEHNFAERFQREARTMAGLNHPHIVTLHDFGETETGYLYIVMEYVDGKDMHDAIVSGRTGVNHGAAVVVRRDLRPREGDIVLAHLPGQLVLRRWTGERLASEPLAGHAQVTPAEQIISLLGVAMLVWQRLR